MRWFRSTALAAMAALLHACTAPSVAPATSPGTAREARAAVTILIGIDGFRADYLDRGVTPTLSRLAAEGAHGAMRPSFPVKTFPNFYTLVTGLRPDRHGIVANRFEDPARPGQRFTQASSEAWWWDQGRADLGRGRARRHPQLDPVLARLQRCGARGSPLRLAHIRHGGDQRRARRYRARLAAPSG